MINKRGQTFQNTFYKFMFMALILVGLFSFAFTLQEDNSVGNPISNNSLFNNTANTLRDSISDAEDTGKTQQEAFNEEEPRSGFGSIVLFGIVSTGKTYGTMIYSLFGPALRIPMIVLGINSEIISAFVSILALAIIAGLWYLWKLGG